MTQYTLYRSYYELANHMLLL